jgi:hypothetical protein
VSDWFDAHPRDGLLLGAYTEPGTWNPRFPRQACDLTPTRARARASSVCIFLRRRVLGNVRFDERLGAGTDLPCGEDPDLVVRLLLDGCRGRYEPGFVVYHPIERGRLGDFGWSRANAYVLMRHALRPHVPLLTRAAAGLLKWAVRAPLARADRERLRAIWSGYQAAIRDRVSGGC